MIHPLIFFRSSYSANLGMPIEKAIPVTDWLTEMISYDWLNQKDDIII